MPVASTSRSKSSRRGSRSARRGRGPRPRGSTGPSSPIPRSGSANSAASGAEKPSSQVQTPSRPISVVSSLIAESSLCGALGGSCERRRLSHPRARRSRVGGAVRIDPLLRASNVACRWDAAGCDPGAAGWKGAAASATLAPPAGSPWGAHKCRRTGADTARGGAGGDEPDAARRRARRLARQERDARWTRRDRQSRMEHGRARCRRCAGGRDVGGWFGSDAIEQRNAFCNACHLDGWLSGTPLHTRPSRVTSTRGLTGTPGSLAAAHAAAGQPEARADDPGLPLHRLSRRRRLRREARSVKVLAAKDAFWWTCRATSRSPRGCTGRCSKTTVGQCHPTRSKRRPRPFDEPAFHDLAVHNQPAGRRLRRVSLASTRTPWRRATLVPGLRARARAVRSLSRGSSRGRDPTDSMTPEEA